MQLTGKKSLSLLLSSEYSYRFSTSLVPFTIRLIPYNSEIPLKGIRVYSKLTSDSLTLPDENNKEQKFI